MGYKIFYSYQSDIDKKLNQVFIRTAIDNAIANITQYDIEPLVEGFSNASGNPPLAKTMFDESRNSDIFIADVTFTMAKQWHNPIMIGEDEESISIQIPKGNLKPSPNPNVLLETGYSWALKDYDRTILIMNDAFGHPKDLPVDMDGLRWPITYKLSHERAAIAKKYDKELNGLSIALQGAITAAIKSNINYQLDKLIPFENHKRWNRLHRYQFFLTDELKEKLIQLRDNISNYKNPVRITGIAGTGKSRLAYEIFQNNDDLAYDKENETIIYYDLIGTNYNDINLAVSYLISQNQPKIVIVDSCPIDIHKKLTLQFKSTNVKLITISTVLSNMDTDNATIFIEEEISIKVNKKIIEDKFKSIGKSIDFDISTFKLQETITILENNLENEIDSKSSIELLKIIIDEDNVRKGGFKFLQVISLFGIVGVSDTYNKEILTLKALFFDNDINIDVDNIIETLVSKKLLSQKGDFILSSSFEEELVLSWWGENRDSLNLLIQKLEGTGLLVKFIERLQSFLKDEYFIELKGLLFGESSALLNNEFTDSYEGSDLLNKLVNDFPLEVLDILTKKIEG
jgi:hypothetical protein